MKQFTCRVLLTVLFIVFISIAIGYFIGIRVNVTPSIPLGIYKIVDREPQKGDFIIFCPPDLPLFQEVKLRGWINEGFCEGKLGLMMKVLVAVQGDVVSSSFSGVIINDQPYPNSKPIQGLRVPISFLTNYKLKEGEILTMTDHNPLSFDGRYYGILNKKNIKGVIEPLLIW